MTWRFGVAWSEDVGLDIERQIQDGAKRRMKKRLSFVRRSSFRIRTGSRGVIRSRSSSCCGRSAAKVI
jgi:hypothetical protein